MAQSEASKEIKRINQRLNQLKRTFGEKSQIYTRNLDTIKRIFGNENVQKSRSGNYAVRNTKITQSVIEEDVYYTYYKSVDGKEGAVPHQTRKALNRISWTSDIIQNKKKKLEEDNKRRFSRSEVITQVKKEDKEAKFISDHLNEIYAYEREIGYAIIGAGIGTMDPGEYSSFKEWYYDKYGEGSSVSDRPVPLDEPDPTVL